MGYIPTMALIYCWQVLASPSTLKTLLLSLCYPIYPYTIIQYLISEQFQLLPNSQFHECLKNASGNMTSNVQTNMKLDESFIIWAPNAVVTQYNSHTVETNK
jgi:hypothetical protein